VKAKVMDLEMAIETVKEMEMDLAMARELDWAKEME
jgi:hypothetical protein